MSIPSVTRGFVITNLHRQQRLVQKWCYVPSEQVQFFAAKADYGGMMVCAQRTAEELNTATEQCLRISYLFSCAIEIPTVLINWALKCADQQAEILTDADYYFSDQIASVEDGSALIDHILVMSQANKCPQLQHTMHRMGMQIYDLMQTV
jgi:hypothetical protein